MADHCQKHGKKFEAFCTDCGGKNEPMCSICMCEHIYIKHFKGVTHISKVVDESLVKFDKMKEAFAVQKVELTKYEKKITTCAGEMGTIRDELVKKHKELLEKCSQMKGAETEVALCREMLMKELAKCKNQLNSLSSDPEKTGSKVKQYLDAKKYWLAYKESSEFIEESVKLNDQGLKDGLDKCKAEVDKYNEQLKQMQGLTDLSFRSYIELQKSYNELKKVNEDNIGILLHCLFSSRKN
jgi:chromosome condensin MukBEF ATPase and DNA-binding subunit MukB